MVYDLTIGRTDLRWLNSQGKETLEKPKGAYLFRSSRTDEAQERIEENGFDGSYLRHLSTGHAETQWINFAMLAFAQKHNGMVGTTLEGLVRDPVGEVLTRELPPGRILYEVLACPSAFYVSLENGVQLPDFKEGYAAVDIWAGVDELSFIPQKKDDATNAQAFREMDRIYIELQPEFVANLGSTNLDHGPLGIGKLREFVEANKDLSSTF